MSTDTLGRAWDDFDAYLFDIDGTLMNARDAVHYHAFNAAVSGVAGRPLTIDGVVAHGNVDVGILRDAFAKHGVDEALWRPRLAELIAGMGAHVSAHRGELQLHVLPGAVDVLEHLRARGKVLGTATGNLAAIGKIKMETAGLWRYFDFGGWSDAHETRAEVFGAALAHARRLSGSDASVCVVGDTPLDIQAAHANGLPVVAVATGIYSYEQLAALAPERLLHSLTELLRAVPA